MNSRPSKTDRFLVVVRDELRTLLPGEWETEAPPSVRLLRRYPWGYGGVSPKMKYKYLPVTRVFLHYGVFHDCLDPLFCQIDEARGFSHLDTFHVSQTSMNRVIGSSEPSVSVKDYRMTDPAAIARALLGVSVETLLAFFDRFGSLLEIRRSLEEADGALLTYGLGKIMATIDIYLGDVEHLRRFRESSGARHEVRSLDDAARALGVELWSGAV